jgi:hypothetical protein
MELKPTPTCTHVPSNLQDQAYIAQIKGAIKIRREKPGTYNQMGR